MKRWHRETALMLKRYRIELATHTRHIGHGQGWPWRALAPIGVATDIACHCARGIGTMRKHRPGICEKRRCSCKRWKRHDPRRSDLRLWAMVRDADAA